MTAICQCDWPIEKPYMYSAENGQLFNKNLGIGKESYWVKDRLVYA